MATTTFRKGCEPCSKQGYYGYNRKDTCTVCNGRGENVLGGSPADYKPCGPCSGQGYYGYNRKDTCAVCNGIGLIEIFPHAPESPVGEQGITEGLGKGTYVFLVHGRDLTTRDRIHLYLSNDLGLEVKVMAGEAHGGRTLPEKFEEIAGQCSFAVFLLTADDECRLSDGTVSRRARQNVILEIGYFWGSLGRRKKVAFLVDPELDPPSDIQGVGWIPLTLDLGETRLRLRTELEAAGLLLQASG